MVNRPKDSIKNKIKDTTDKIAQQAGLNSIRPLTVFVIFFDSFSRSHFYRMFPKTIKYINTTFPGEFKDDFILYDFLANNAHGVNTKPNLVPLFYGRSLEEQEKINGKLSYKNRANWEKLKDMQKDTVWKHFEKMGFVTMMGYDSVNDFFNTATGNIIDTHHRVFNFWKAAKTTCNYNEFSPKPRCVGSEEASFYMLDYLAQFAKNYEGFNKFGYLHISIGHKEVHNIKNSDQYIKGMLKKLFKFFKDKKDEDFVIIIGSDHGKQAPSENFFAPEYMENQLPLHLMLVNKDLVKRLNAHNILVHNTQRLIGRFDWYMTLKHLATVPYGESSLNSSVYKEWKYERNIQGADSVFLTKYSDTKTCSDVRIDDYICVCNDYEEMSKTEIEGNAAIKKIVTMAIENMNNKVKDDKADFICQSIELDYIQSVYSMRIFDHKLRYDHKIRIKIKENKDVVFEI